MYVHPSRKIIGSLSEELKGKKIVLGITSSVSLYRSIDVARTLMKNGAEVTVVMSDEAARLVSPTLFEWATGNKVFYTRFGGETGHIYLSEEYDAMVIAPATANTLSKIAHGIADTPVTLTALAFMGAKKPVLIVTTMHRQMYEAPQVQEAIERLEEMGVIFHDVLIEEDRVKYPEAWEVSWHIETILARGRDLKEHKILVTAGPTREYIDPVRFISNPSTGKMGVSLALEAKYRGAFVSLVHGPLCNIEAPIKNKTMVETTEEMLNAVLGELKLFNPDMIFLAAAPVDFKPVTGESSKIKSNNPITLSLTTTQKIIAEVEKRRKPGTLLVGFAAETVDSDEELVEKAGEKLRRYKLDMIVANNVSRKDVGFASEYNEVLVLKDNGDLTKIDKANKRLVSRRILDIAGEYLREKRHMR